jgi:hypothetical protein
VEAREAAEILGYFAAAFPKNDLTEETASVWMDQLRLIDFDLGKRAAKKLVAAHDWFPTVSQFRDFCRVEMRISVDEVGCERCDRGFVVTEGGEAGPCRVCRPTVSFTPLRQVRELAPVEKNWKESLHRARLELEGKRNG